MLTADVADKGKRFNPKETTNDVAVKGWGRGYQHLQLAKTAMLLLTRTNNGYEPLSFQIMSAPLGIR